VGGLQPVEVGADLLENLLHGALGVELGAEGLAGGGSPKGTARPELVQGWILARGGKIETNLGQKGAGPSLEGVSVSGTGESSQLPGVEPIPNELGFKFLPPFPHHPHPPLPLPWDHMRPALWTPASATSLLTWRTMPLLL